MSPKTKPPAKGAEADLDASEGASKDQYVRASEAVRSALKWAVAALAAIAALLLGTSPLTGMGKLAVDDTRLWAALGSGLIALIAAATIVVMAVWILTPVDVSFGTISGSVRRSLDEDSEALRTVEGVRTVAELQTKWSRLQRDRALLASHNGSADRVITAEDRQRAIAADRQLHDLSPVVQELTENAAWLALADRWRKFRYVGALLVIVAGASILVYGWAANPGEDTPKSSAAAPLQPASVTVRLGSSDRERFAAEIGDECVLSPVAAILVATPTDSHYDLIVLPTSKCQLRRLQFQAAPDTSVAATSSAAP